MTRLRREALALARQGFSIKPHSDRELILAVAGAVISGVAVGLNDSWNEPEWSAGRLLQRCDDRVIFYTKAKP